jgi:hypothetical protein
MFLIVNLRRWLCFSGTGDLPLKVIRKCGI